MSERPTEQPATVHRGPSIGTILFGGILILLGVLWLLDRTGAVDLSWSIIGSAILILAGVGLLIQSFVAGSDDGLIWIGITITAILTLANIADVDVDGSIGDRTEQPASIEELNTRYNLGIGTQTLNLRSVDFPPGETTIEASVGIGELVVQLPEGVDARVEWSVGIGDATIFGDEVGGVGQNGDDQTPGFGDAERRIILELSVGIGDIEVTQ